MSPRTELICAQNARQIARAFCAVHLQLHETPVRGSCVQCACKDLETAIQVPDLIQFADTFQGGERWPGQLNSKQVGGRITSLICRGLPVTLAGNCSIAGDIVAGLLKRAAIHRYREARSLISNGQASR